MGTKTFIKLLRLKVKNMYDIRMTQIDKSETISNVYFINGHKCLFKTNVRQMHRLQVTILHTKIYNYKMIGIVNRGYSQCTVSCCLNENIKNATR